MISIPDVLLNLLNWFAWFVAVTAVVMGLYTGFLFLTSRGDPARLADARKTLIWVVVGVVVAVISFSIISVVKSVMGV